MRRAPVSRLSGPDSAGFSRTRSESSWLCEAKYGSAMRFAGDLRHLRGHRGDPAASDRPGDLGDAHQVAAAGAPPKTAPTGTPLSRNCRALYDPSGVLCAWWIEGPQPVPSGLLPRGHRDAPGRRRTRYGAPSGRRRYVGDADRLPVSGADRYAAAMVRVYVGGLPALPQSREGRSAPEAS